MIVFMIIVFFIIVNLMMSYIQEGIIRIFQTVIAYLYFAKIKIHKKIVNSKI